jgi:hypothetical protein
VTATFRDFDAEVEARPPSCTFRLGGREWACRDGQDVPWATVRDLMLGAATSSGYSAEQAQDMVESGQSAAKMAEGLAGSLAQIGPFFRAMLVPGQADDFEAMINSPDSPLSVAKIGELMAFIAQSVLRPTQAPQASSPGRKATKTTSKAASSSRAKKRTASAG